MSDKKQTTRREMLQQSAGAAIAGISIPLLGSCDRQSEPDVTQIVPKQPQPKASPIEQVGVGIIGCGRRNGQLITGRGGQGNLPRYARIVAVADLNKLRAEQWGERHKCPAFQDYRELLDRKDVEVVIHATPEHWHYLPCIHAAQAGKDMYGEQPLSHTIREGRVMVQAVRKHNRVFQTGEQQRSHGATRKAAELIINGRIGRLHTVIGYNYPSPWECKFPGHSIPDALDWDRWCGPNPVVPYNTNLYLSRVPYEREPLQPEEEAAIGPGWMSFRPYSGGELVNWGCHGLSMVQWVMQTDNSGPVEVWVEPPEALDSLVYDKPENRDRGDTYTNRSIINYRFDNDVVLKLESTDKKLGGGATFIGEQGKITIYRGGYECEPKGLDEAPLPADAIRLYESDDHMENFFQCVRSREDPIMNIESGHRVATFCHLGNIARWLGRRLKWDPVNEEFPGDDEANGYLDFQRRAGYELPDRV